jgi:hypothetical protein
MLRFRVDHGGNQFAVLPEIRWGGAACVTMLPGLRARMSGSATRLAHSERSDAEGLRDRLREP